MTMKKSTIVDVISYLLILLFVYTGVSKLLTFNVFHNQIEFHPLLSRYAVFLAVVVPVIELLIAACLLSIRFKRLGLYGAFALMSVFTLYVGYMLAFIPHENLPCACGGVLQIMTWDQHLVFNIFFTCLSLLAIWLGSKWEGIEPHEMKSL